MRRTENGALQGALQAALQGALQVALQRPANRAQVVENIGVLHAALQCAAVRCAAAPPFRGLQQRCSAAEAPKR
jgi:hypothetical protein